MTFVIASVAEPALKNGFTGSPPLPLIGDAHSPASTILPVQFLRPQATCMHRYLRIENLAGPGEEAVVRSHPQDMSNFEPNRKLREHDFEVSLPVALGSEDLQTLERLLCEYTGKYPHTTIIWQLDDVTALARGWVVSSNWNQSWK